MTGYEALSPAELSGLLAEQDQVIAALREAAAARDEMAAAQLATKDAQLAALAARVGGTGAPPGQGLLHVVEAAVFGLALLRAVTDRTGLTRGLSRALATPRLLIHDRGRVLADLACAIADGAEVISDFRVMGDQKELFGPVASVPTAWRTLSEVAAGGKRAQARITTAVNTARRSAWAGIEARHGAIPGVRIADKVLEGVTAPSARIPPAGQPSGPWRRAGLCPKPCSWRGRVRW